MLKHGEKNTLPSQTAEEDAAVTIQRWYRRYRSQSHKQVQGLLKDTKLRLLEQHRHVAAKEHRGSSTTTQKQRRRKHLRPSKQETSCEPAPEQDAQQVVATKTATKNAGDLDASSLTGSQRLNPRYLKTMKARATRRVQHLTASTTSAQVSPREAASDDDPPVPRTQMLRHHQHQPSQRYRTDARQQQHREPEQHVQQPFTHQQAPVPARPVSTDRKEIDTTYKVQTIAPDNGQAATLTRASTQQQQAVRHRDGTTSTTTKASTAADSARLASLLDFLNTVDETNKSMQDELSQHSDTSRVQAVQPNDDPLNRSLGTPGGMQSYRGTVGAGASIITATATDSSGALTTDLAVETTSAVTAKLVRQELQIKEQGAVIESYKTKVSRLETELTTCREALAERTKASTPSTKATKSKTSATAGGSVSAAELAESNRTIQRHLQFIDRLIHEKKTLVAQLKELDERCTTKLNTMRSAHEGQLQKQKELLLTKEKQRREKWMHKEAKKIKDMTIKGLEPDIQRLVAQHKAEIERIRSAAGDTEAARQAQACVHLRDEHTRAIERLAAEANERERAAVRAEREANRDMLQKQAVAEEKAFQEEKRKMTAELLQTKKDAEQQLAAQRRTLTAEFEASQEMTQLSLRRARTEAERLLRDTNARHDEELRNLKSQLAIEKESWEDMFMRKQDAKIKAKEQEIRERLRIDRDKQLAMAIERLASEASAKEAEYKQEYDVRLKRMQQKFVNQLEDAEQSERATLAKYNDTRQRLVESSEELSSVRGVLVQREQDLARAKEVSERLSKERDKVADVIRVEFAENLATSEALVESLRRELREAKETSYREVEKIRNAKDAELEDIHHRVQKTVAKKDETIVLLREQAETATRRAAHLEGLVETQRQHMLHM